MNADISRVNNAIAKHIEKFLGTHKEFHVEELRKYVFDNVNGYVAPASPDRILRDLRQKGRELRCRIAVTESLQIAPGGADEVVLMLTVGSLFSGTGGLDLGLEQAGMRTVWQVEFDDWARGKLEENFPHTEKFKDVREVGKHNLRPVDLICGGFPCQDLSIANLKGLGLAGERSGLCRRGG